MEPIWIHNNVVHRVGSLLATFVVVALFFVGTRYWFRARTSKERKVLRRREVPPLAAAILCWLLGVVVALLAVGIERNSGIDGVRHDEVSCEVYSGWRRETILYSEISSLRGEFDRTGKRSTCRILVATGDREWKAWARSYDQAGMERLRSLADQLSARTGSPKIDWNTNAQVLRH